MTSEKTRTYKRTTPEQATKIQELLAKGFTAKVVADNVGVSIATVYKLSAKNGNGDKEQNQPKTVKETTLTLASRVRSSFDRLESKVKFHQEKAVWYQSQLDELRGAFNN